MIKRYRTSIHGTGGVPGGSFIKRRTKIALIVLPLVLILLITCIIYFKPLHYSGSCTACTVEGDTILVEFDVILHRGWWNKVKITGSIFVDGREYVNFWDLNRKYHITVEDYTNGVSQIFCQPADTYMESFRGDKVYLHMKKARLDNFMISMVNRLDEIPSDPTDGNASAQNGENETPLYFGPAASQAEAEEVYREWFYNG